MLEVIITNFNELIEFLKGLNPEEIWFIVIALAIIILLIVYRYFGVKLAFFLLLLYLIVYVLYINDVVGTYEERELIIKQREQTLLNELEK